MSINVYLRSNPYRSIALVTQSHALTFRHNPSIPEIKTNSVSSDLYSENEGSSQCIVEFTAVSSVDLDNYQSLSALPVHGTLGLITNNNDVFLCVVTNSSKVASVRPGETVEKILGVEFYCLNTGDFDDTLKGNLDSYSGNDGYYTSFRSREALLEHPCEELQKLLIDGSFYYSTDFDLTNRLQDRNIEGDSLDMDNMDSSFLWNSYMINPLVKFRSRLFEHEKKALDRSRILTSAIRGFVFTITIPSIAIPLRKGELTRAPASLTIISRLSCKRVGTRFNSRGIDDDGNVANFVESEIIYWCSTIPEPEATPESDRPCGICFSYVQIRGSVPIFWEQAAGLIPAQQKITIARSPEGTQISFDKHFSELEQNYGSVHVINLLSKTKLGEAELTSRYQKALDKRLGGKTTKNRRFLEETDFDFHAETKGPNGYESAVLIRRDIQNSANAYAYFLSEDQIDSNDDPQKTQSCRTVVVLQQQGVFRTNCLDCLDRTNLIQTIVSKMALEIFFAHRLQLAASDFWSRHSVLWADNGDMLSRIYAGTGALKSSFTRHGKMSLAGAIADARKSAARLYINNFADKGRQNTIDLLLGRSKKQSAIQLFDPINDYVTAELSKKILEYQSSETIRIWCGTFNLNGRTLGPENDLLPWLCPGLAPTQQTPEIVAVGFQEMVELSPQQLMSSDPTRREAWEKIVLQTLNKQAKASGGGRYIFLRSGQLVGASLMIFVKNSVLPKIRNVDGSVKKTGMSGIAGNKGAVAIRMDYANTSLCFVTAHLASGFSNVEERNSDYNTINNGLRFKRNREIDDHDTVIWMGDFNYRIGLGIEKVKQLIKFSDLETLCHYDQLKLQMVSGRVFSNYSESQITFAPTYKYDLGKDVYDTSEKARVPAWTDRILLKGTNTQQINYNIADLRFSDHRPVYGTFICSVSTIDEARREALSCQLYEERKAQIEKTKISTTKDKSINKNFDIDDFQGTSVSLANSYRKKWRLDNKEPVYSQIESQKGIIQNQMASTEESDWVTVHRVSPKISRSPPSTLKSQNLISNSTNLESLPKPKTADLLTQSSIASQTQDLTQAFFDDNSVRRQHDTQPLPSLSIDRHFSSQSSEQSIDLSNKSNSKSQPPPVARKPLHLSSSPVLPVSTSPVSSTSAKSPPSMTSQFSSPRDFQNGIQSKENLNKTRFPPPPPLPRRTGWSTNQLPTKNSFVTSERPNSYRRTNTESKIDTLGSESEASIIDWEIKNPK